MTNRTQFCEQCGTALPADAVFCEQCGARVAETAQTQQVVSQQPQVAVPTPTPVPPGRNGHAKQVPAGTNGHSKQSPVNRVLPFVQPPTAANGHTNRLNVIGIDSEPVKP